MSAANIDATKVAKFLVLGTSPVQEKVTKVVKFLVIDPTGTGPAPAPRARRHVRVTRKTVAA